MRKHQTSKMEQLMRDQMVSRRAVADDEPYHEVSVLGCDGLLPLPPHIIEAAGLRIKPVSGRAGVSR